MNQRIENDFSGSRLIFHDDEQVRNSLADFIGTHTNINRASMLDFLLYGSILPPHSPLEGVAQLYPSETIEQGVSRLGWNEMNYEVEHRTLPQFVDAFDQCLEDYFRTHQSETVLLSGGIDSATLLSYLPRGARCITWGGRGESTSDVIYSRITAKTFGVADHRFVFADFEQDMALYKEAVKTLKIPILFNSAVPFLRMAEVGKELGLTNWLVGQNADTLFMSYPAPVMAKHLMRLNSILPINPLSFLPSRKSFLFSTPSIVRLMAYFKSLGVYPGSWISVPDAYFKEKEAIFAGVPARTLEQRIIALEEILTESRRNQICQNEIPALSSIKALCPYYERPFVQLALSIPPALRSTRRYSKVILKELAKKRGVSEEVIYKQKSGLSYGLNDFMDKKLHLPIWDQMEQDEDLNRLIRVREVRSQHEGNYLTFIMLMSLHYWFELVARPEGLKLPDTL